MIGRAMQTNDPFSLNLIRIITGFEDLGIARTTMAAEPLGRAAAARHHRAVERAQQALRGLAGEGAPISVQGVARRAGVSRRWLHTQLAPRSETERSRDQPHAVGAGIPARQRATGASLRQRLESPRAQAQRLRGENTYLKAEIAIAHGRRRASQ